MKKKAPLMAILTGEPGWPDAPGGPGGPGGPWNVNLKDKYKINALKYTLFRPQRNASKNNTDIFKNVSNLPHYIVTIHG